MYVYFNYWSSSTFERTKGAVLPRFLSARARVDMSLAKRRRVTVCRQEVMIGK